MISDTNTEKTGISLARIRPLTSGEANRIFEFYQTVLEPTRAIFGNYSFTRETAEKIANESGNAASKQHYVAVVDCGKEREEMIIGLLWFWGWKQKVPWFGIMIADAYQNLGLGKKMMEYAISEAQKYAKGGILLTTAKSNVRAQKLYKRYGFAVIGEDSHGEHLMLLNFADPAFAEHG